ncbi:MAG: hypothetical protein AB1634_18350, partial [Thermodesulfobacteriota bacterium]
MRRPLLPAGDLKTAPALPARDQLALAFLALAFTPLAQLVFRAADDNRLTSWAWIFAAADPLPV